MSKIVFEKDFSRHPLHYFTLLVVQLVGLWAVLWFNFAPGLQFSVLLTMAVCYIIWGIIHHNQHGDLHLKIILEYILVGLLGILIFGSVILRV